MNPYFIDKARREHRVARLSMVIALALIVFALPLLLFGYCGWGLYGVLFIGALFQVGDYLRAKRELKAVMLRDDMAQRVRTVRTPARPMGKDPVKTTPGKDKARYN